MLNSRSVLRVALGASLLIASSAWAVEVAYEAIDRPDVTFDQDLWQYRYTLSGSWAQYDGLSLTFSAGSYNWLSLVDVRDAFAFALVQPDPDPRLNADGLLSLTADRAINAETFNFAVEFSWLGSGDPGSQLFETYDENFTITGGGNTAPIPEPSTYALMAAGLAAIGFVASRRKINLGGAVTKEGV